MNTGFRKNAFATMAAMALSAGFATFGAVAQDAAEKQTLLKCEKDICGIIVGKEKAGADLNCDLTKTWAKEDIEKGAKEKSLSWGFGTAQCKLKVAVKRGDVVTALTTPEYTLKIDKQSVACEIERGAEKYPIKMTLAPELKFKDGKNTGVSLKINDIEGTSLVKGVVWTAATLEQNFGLFESDLVKEVNKFIEKQCPKRLADSK